MERRRNGKSMFVSSLEFQLHNSHLEIELIELGWHKSGLSNTNE